MTKIREAKQREIKTGSVVEVTAPVDSRGMMSVGSIGRVIESPYDRKEGCLLVEFLLPLIDADRYIWLYSKEKPTFRVFYRPEELKKIPYGVEPTPLFLIQFFVDSDDGHTCMWSLHDITFEEDFQCIRENSSEEEKETYFSWLRENTHRVFFGESPDRKTARAEAREMCKERGWYFYRTFNWQEDKEL